MKYYEILWNTMKYYEILKPDVSWCSDQHVATLREIEGHGVPTLRLQASPANPQLPLPSLPVASAVRPGKNRDNSSQLAKTHVPLYLRIAMYCSHVSSRCRFNHLPTRSGPRSASGGGTSFASWMTRFTSGRSWAMASTCAPRQGLPTSQVNGWVSPCFYPK